MKIYDEAYGILNIGNKINLLTFFVPSPTPLYPKKENICHYLNTICTYLSFFKLRLQKQIKREINKV